MIVPPTTRARSSTASRIKIQGFVRSMSRLCPEDGLAKFTPCTEQSGRLAATGYYLPMQTSTLLLELYDAPLPLYCTNGSIISP